MLVAVEGPLPDRAPQTSVDSGGGIAALLAAALLAIVATASACSGGSSERAVYDDGDAGSEILVDAGEQFEIRLESNPSTGYLWALAVDTDRSVLELRSQDHESATTDRVGASGHDVFVFEAVSGATMLRLEYVRPFDDPVIAERVAEYLVRVDAAPWPPRTVDAPSTATATAPVGVGALLDGGPLTDVTVSGFVVWDSGGARLCEVLMESFPPQCGGAAVTISDPDSLQVELEEAQSVRWTNDPVQIVGDFDGSRLTLSSEQ